MVMSTKEEIMDLHARMSRRFAQQLIATPEGRAHLLNQVADAEANGENRIPASS